MGDICKFETVLEILVGKWKPIILFQLLSQGTMRFGELQRAIPNITKKMLTAQLRELEYHDIVHRKVYREVPLKVEYSFSEYGKSLLPVLQAMNDWGMAHVKHLNEKYGVQEEDQPLQSDIGDFPVLVASNPGGGSSPR